MEDSNDEGIDPGNQRVSAIYYMAFDIILFLIVVCVGIFVFKLLNFSLHTQIDTYIEASKNAAKTSNHGPALLLTFTKAMDSAILRSTVVFMGFIVTLIGAMYVLRAATAVFSLDVKSGPANGTLQTSSPGLVMVVLGIVTVGLALYARVDLSIQESYDPSAEQSRTAPTPTIVAPGESGDQAVSGKTKKKQDRRDVSIVVTEKTSGVILELPPFPARSVTLTTQQKELLEDTAFSFLKFRGAEVHFAAQSDGKLTVGTKAALLEGRRAAVGEFLKKLKPPDNPFDSFNSHIQANASGKPRGLEPAEVHE